MKLLEANFRAGSRAVVLTISDRCSAGLREDLSGPAVVRMLKEAGCDVGLEVLPDEQPLIEAALRRYQRAAVSLIVTTGGTGLAPRDVTPEATRAVCTRLIEGLSERMRADGLTHTPFAPLSRAVCGVAGTTIVINLPGSPAGAESSLGSILGLLPHAIDLVQGSTEHGG